MSKIHKGGKSFCGNKVHLINYFQARYEAGIKRHSKLNVFANLREKCTDTEHHELK